MLDIGKIHQAIEEFVFEGHAEEHHMVIPENKERHYLGMSALGGECTREIWYSFRKVAKKSFPSRILRLFRRGHLEEYSFNYFLRGIGFEVFEVDAEGKQFKATDFEGHLSGSMDGVGKAPKKFWMKGSKPHPFLLEYKTYSDKRFNALVKNGVKKSDIKYFSQCILYCGYNGLKAALFIAVNKNTDELHMEWIPFNKAQFGQLVDRAQDILEAASPPERVSNNPSWYACKYCDFYKVCHEGAASDVSCRTCKFASPGEDRTWVCNKNQEFGTVCKLYKDVTK